MLTVTLLVLAVSGCASNQASYNNTVNDALSAQAVGSEATPFKILHSELPIYPNSYRQRGKPLDVLVEFVVGVDGKAEKITVVRTPDRFYDILFVECIEKWRFEPAKKNGVPVAVTARVPLQLRVK